MAENTIQWDKDADGIVTLTLDDPTGSANVMNEHYKESMHNAVERLVAEQDSITGVVIASAKKTFFAGGDLKGMMNVGPDNAAESFAEVEFIKADLRKLETLGKPVVAAINGAALGGGLEIALACHHRIAADVKGVVIGLPEVTLGLLPGGGGVARTVRMFGIQKAFMEVLSQGTRFKPGKAKEIGLVDELVGSVDELVPAAKAWIKENPDAHTQPWDQKGYKMPGGTPSHPALAAILPSFPALLKKQLNITDAAIKQVIEGYAREAGVRSLEKLLHKILRKGIVKLLENPDQPVKVGVSDLQSYLGQPSFKKEKSLKGTGVVTGLAWTAMGGATLSIEASRIHSSQRGFKLTGQLGDVMKESAEIAYSFVSSNLKRFKGDPTFFDKSFVHLHVPEGATPKDGPSAGVTMATALLSIARRESPQQNIAMTGELTLTGQVLPVGGIREKVIAARRQKISNLILPDANRGDYEELPGYLKEGLTVNFAKQYNDVFQVCFGNKPRKGSSVH